MIDRVFKTADIESLDLPFPGYTGDCILEGDFINENKTYGSGDFLHSKPGTVHGPHTTKRGCSILVLYSANTGEPDPNDFFLADVAKRS